MCGLVYGALEILEGLFLWVCDSVYDWWLKVDSDCGNVKLEDNESFGQPWVLTIWSC